MNDDLEDVSMGRPHGMSRLTRLLFRESSQRPFQPLHQDDDPTWRRASGGRVCHLCGCAYREHPLFENYDTHHLEHDSLDHRLCDGTVVHL